MSVIGMNRLRRHKRSIPIAGISLTDRDVQILAAAFLNPGMRSHHVQPLFPSVKARNERLKLLSDHGYLAKTFPASSAFGGAVYHAGKAGVPVALASLAASGLDFSYEDITAQSRRPSLSLLEHATAIASVYSACCLRDPGAGAVTVERFLPERLVRFEYEVRSSGSQGAWRPRCFAPDGALILSFREDTMAFAVIFLEIDLATVPVARIAKNKFEGFAQAAAGALTVERLGTRRAALAVVTVSDSRLRRLAEAAAEQGCAPVLLTTLAEIERAGLSAAWQVPGTDRAMTLGEFMSELGVTDCTA